MPQQLARRAALLLSLLPSALAAATPDARGALSWRLVGPFRGGWATTAAGVPDAPDTFYVGTAGGGVWKTANAGRTYAPIFDGSPSIGALAIAPSDPRVLYVGTGQVDARYDIAKGDGVYRSSDGGASWQRVGLAGTGHIGDLLVDPRDPDTVLAGALGHVFGPGPERGVFRTTDGGKSWQRTLAIGDDTGVVALAADPTDPRVVFAAAWQARMHPWLSYFTPLRGPGSGLYRSGDGGLTWERLTGHGLPDGELGRIGLAVAHAGATTRVYATVDAKEKAGLYRSDDGGASWRLAFAEPWVASSYTARLTVAPDDPDTVYVMGQSIRRSRDGGKTFTIVKGAPGGDDYHSLWINPKHPDHFVTACDQGAVVSVDAGGTWSSWYNQPTGQFYRLAADRRFPYWIYSGQQDSGTVAIASRSDYGSITARDWHPVGAEERDGDVPDPGDANVVYGAGLGGKITRWDARNGESQNVAPWPLSSYGKRPTDYKYHYTWITPLAVAQRPPFALYVGAQVLFRSTNQGASWSVISPDLSPRTAAARHCDADPTNEEARACGFGVIHDIGLSRRDPNEIWLGTDDGRVQVTFDAGKRWQDVTPRGLPAWAKISVVEPSATTAGAAYLAVDNHRQDDFAPHLFRTHDRGRSWTEIDRGLPAGFVDVVRADPVRAGLLYAGGEAGVFVSQDDGESWSPLQRNLPPAIVTDLLVHEGDLIAATQGRAIWVLDDVAPLRERVPAGAAAHLFAPAPAVRLRGNQNRDTPLPREEPAGRNPPAGALLDYWLASDSPTPVVLEIRDARGGLLRRFASDEPAVQLPAKRYYEERWEGPSPAISAKAGAHRFVWDLRQGRPRAERYEAGMGAIDGEPLAFSPQGPLAPPGRYRVTLLAAGRELQAPLEVKPDPRVRLDARALAQAVAFARATGAELDAARGLLGQARAVKEQLTKLAAAAGPPAALARAAAERLEPLLAGKGESAPNLAAIEDALLQLAVDAESSDRAPPAGARQVLAECAARLVRARQLWTAAAGAELARLDAALKAAGSPPIEVPPAGQRHDPPPAAEEE